MKCKQCSNETVGRSLYCSESCKTVYNRNKRNSNQQSPVCCGYLYLFHCVGFPYYKIGVTTGNPQSRLQALQTGLPFDLELEYAVQVPDIYREEALLHETYKDNHLRGEWFNLTDTELEYLKGELVTIRHGYVWESL